MFLAVNEINVSRESLNGELRKKKKSDYCYSQKILQ